jgi:uncharacterized protein YqfB (UPF0267 family)
MLHELKILPAYFNQVSAGYKTFEIRKNDRNFMVGDNVLLREFEDGQYTGCKKIKKITYVLTSEEFEGLKDGYCVFSIV